MRRYQHVRIGRPFSALWLMDHPGAYEARSLTRWWDVAVWISKSWFDPYPPGSALWESFHRDKRRPRPFFGRAYGWKAGIVTLHVRRGFRSVTPAAKRIGNLGATAMFEYRAWKLYGPGSPWLAGAFPVFPQSPEAHR